MDETPDATRGGGGGAFDEVAPPRMSPMEPRRLSEPSVREPANDRGASCIERWKPAMPDMAERLLGAVGQVGCALPFI